MSTPKPAQYVPVRGSPAAGDIAELITPDELAARQEQQAAYDFGPALPMSATPVTRPRTTRRPNTNILIAIGGGVLAALLIGLSIFTQRSESSTTSTSMASLAPTAATTVATMAATAAATVAPTATAEPGIEATITRAAVVRWAPGGDAQDDPLPAGAVVHVIAYHSGYPAWRAIAGSGIAQPAWVNVAALSSSDTAGLPDLAPPPTATPAPPERVAPAPLVAPVQQPERCATVSSNGESATVCGPEDFATLQQRAQEELTQKLNAHSVPVMTMTPYGG